ncbi:methyltransferase domain-containing protein [Candidatus Falkowbacteria bacterium]|nr:methyltransferase domain-containing protein [Candidatus Falkowbacteria bacterium]
MNFFILGNNPALSVAEISAIYSGNKTGEFLQPDVFLLEEEIDSKALIKRLGGTIKIGKILKSIPREDKEEIKKELFNIIENKSKNSEGKFKFGISCHGKCGIQSREVGIDIKKRLKDSGASIRFVISKEKTLSSVVITQNKLDTKGIEVVLILKGKDVLIGYTEAVQDFKGLSFRDYGRPARDDHSGMIPPKLAQIMLNLSGKIEKDATILDPFCGSGTFLMEAALMGVKNVIGSDASSKAIADSEVNMEWAANKLQIANCKLQIFKSSATEISNHLDRKTIDAVVTEPFLGPQRGKPEAVKVIKELNKLYSDSLEEFAKVLKKDGVVVMIWPVLIRGDRKFFMNPELDRFKIQRILPHIKGLDTTERGSLIYGREGQKVHREIVILKK